MLKSILIIPVASIIKSSKSLYQSLSSTNYSLLEFRIPSYKNDEEENLKFNQK